MDFFWSVPVKIFITGLLLTVIATFTWQSIELVDVHQAAINAATAAANSSSNASVAAQSAASETLSGTSLVGSPQTLSNGEVAATVSYQPKNIGSSVFNYLGVPSPNKPITMTGVAVKGGLGDSGITVSLSDQLGDYSSSWYGPANVELIATTSSALDSTPYFVGIYDESTNSWLSNYNYSGNPISSGTGTGFSVAIDVTNFTDKYVAVVGIFKSNTLLKNATVVAQSSSLVVTLPTLQYQFQSAYPDIWSGGYYFGLYPYAENSEYVIQFPNASTGSSTTLSIEITDITQLGKGNSLANNNVNEPSFLSSDTVDPFVVTWNYNLPSVPTTSYTTMIYPDLSPIENWTFQFESASIPNPAFLAVSNSYSTVENQLLIYVNYNGSTYSSDNYQQASNYDGYDFLDYPGYAFQNSYGQQLYVSSSTKLTGYAILESSSGGNAISLTCSITFSGYYPDAGNCTQQ